jgi:hypothetical protein
MKCELDLDESKKLPSGDFIFKATNTVLFDNDEPLLSAKFAQ